MAEKPPSNGPTETSRLADLGAQTVDRPSPSAAPLFPQLVDTADSTATQNNFERILNIPVMLSVELSRTKLSIRRLLELGQGSVVELDGLAGEPMDILINGCLIAQGEVVVVNDKFGIRLTDIVTPAERIRRLDK